MSIKQITKTFVQISIEVCCVSLIRMICK